MNSELETTEEGRELARLRQQIAAKKPSEPATFSDSFRRITGDPEYLESLRRKRAKYKDAAESIPMHEVKRRRREAFAESGITPNCRFWGASLDNYDTPTKEHCKALEACRAWSRDRDRGDGLLLLGEPGSGKTHLLIAMLREEIRAGRRGKILTAEEFFLGLRSCMDLKVTESGYLNKLIEVDVLALDDLYCLAASKSGHDGSYQYRMLWHLLDRRYFNARPTLASTNRRLADFKDMIDERTRRRLEATIVNVPKRVAP